MKTTVNLSDFRSAFASMDRKENFSYEGLEVLFDYFEQLEEETGEEQELDVIAICCDFTEYESLEEFQNNYGDDYETIEDVENKTTVLKVSDERFIILNF